MVASIWVPVMAAALVFFAMLMAGAFAAGFLVWRYGRRKWRAFHSHGVVVAATGLWHETSSFRMRPRGPVPPGDLHRWTARQVRREMWRSVDHADAAVRAASGVGAPTASLPALCHRLRDAAIGLDQVLRVESAGTVPADVATQAADVMRAAADIRGAAVASASDATGQRVRDLAHDADHEIQCLDAGLASARAALPHPHP
ncbi:MAG TPA: hypothetical protein VMV06_02620 [Acidimicrobiales bacterium]|nr:hypothetical protein [Acidimicrobiales bacterium]